MIAAFIESSLFSSVFFLIRFRIHSGIAIPVMYRLPPFLGPPPCPHGFDVLPRICTGISFEAFLLLILPLLLKGNKPNSATADTNRAINSWISSLLCDVGISRDNIIHMTLDMLSQYPMQHYLSHTIYPNQEYSEEN